MSENIENNMDKVEGFHVDIHQSLVEPILLAGIPRNLAYLMWTIIAAVALGLREIWVVPFGIVIHISIAAATKHDPMFFDVFKKAIKTPKHLVP
jgi:type IV secretion system protein TrbD